MCGSRLLGLTCTGATRRGKHVREDWEHDIHGEEVDVLHVRSGWDLATIEPEDLTPLRLDAVKRLQVPSLDIEMVNQLRLNLLDASAPTHQSKLFYMLAFFMTVQHTHADAALALTNTVDGEQRVRIMGKLCGCRAICDARFRSGFDMRAEFEKQASSTPLR